MRLCIKLYIQKLDEVTSFSSFRLDEGILRQYFFAQDPITLR